MMKHYVLGLIFNRRKDQVLLIKKKRPDWMKDRWNGIGGKIEKNETPIQAMDRESIEETKYSYTWVHIITFVCPGGTVYVFKAISGCEEINFDQVEDEKLQNFNLTNLPRTIMSNVKWMIPLCFSSIQFPIILQQNDLGTY